MLFKPRALAACALIAAFAASAFAAPAYATNIALTTNGAQIGYGAWQEFNVSDTDALDHSVDWIDFANSNSPSFGTPLAFTFTIAAGEVGSFTVVDGGFAGDTFKLTNFGSDIAITSTVASTVYSTAPDTGNNFDAALADPAFSSAVLTFTEGSYSVSGRLGQSVTLDDMSPLNATLGAVRLTVAPIPEPSTYALLLGGLGLVSLLARRRRL